VSLIEWIGESYSPGSMGSVSLVERNRNDRSRGAVLLCALVAILVLGAAYYALFTQGVEPTSKSIAVAALITVAYLAGAYFIHPEPDTSNLGWLGGLMNNPFSYSDDHNRFLLFLQIFLWPGRFLAESLVDLGILVAKSRG